MQKKPPAIHVPLRSFSDDRYVELINCVTVIPDGMTIVSGSKDKTVKLWDSHNGSCLMTIECGYDIKSLLALDDQTIQAGAEYSGGKILKIKVNISSGQGSVVESLWTGVSHSKRLSEQSLCLMMVIQLFQAAKIRP